ncbi:hypothetical protein DFH11DRAFT_1805156 [Phellopilus nigrolimitatus]|nr:hypothetical protein DFH11DRAFT_1805156 [Phellopilus nigrolimitatus]
MASESPLRARTVVSPAALADVPVLSAYELLALSGAFPSAFPLIHFIAPFRAPLPRAGVPPRLRPEFEGTMRRRRQGLCVDALLFKAVLTDASGVEHVVVMKERVLSDYVYPAVDSVRERMWQEVDGVNREVMKVFREVQIKTREDVLGEQDYFTCDLFVHPSIQRRGAGSALLAHCVKIADAARAPLVLEAAPASVPLYAAYGFVTLTTMRVMYRGELVDELPLMRREPAASPPEAPLWAHRRARRLRL